MIKINKVLLDQVIQEARSSDRKRKNYNFHTDFSDPMNRMLNAFEPGTYIHPHKHENPDKREVFILFKGRIAVVFYDDEGAITGHVILDPKEESYGVEIEPGVWHSIIALETGSVIYELKDGPYSPSDDKHFAAWAPKEGESGTEEYMERIMGELHIRTG